MTSVVTVANMALGHLGVATRVSALDPPDGSVEADRCAMFFPVARKALIVASRPSWALKRQQLTLQAASPGSRVWTYSYALPADCLQARLVLPTLTSSALAALNLSTAEWETVDTLQWLSRLVNDNASAPFVVEGETLYTHEPEAVLVYLRDREDLALANPVWTTGLSYMLASLLAGGTLKGRVGASTARSFYDLAVTYANSAAASDANASATAPRDHIPQFIGARR